MSDGEPDPPLPARRLPSTDNEPGYDGLGLDLPELGLDFFPELVGRRAWAKRHTAARAVKTVKFETEDEVKLARLFEFQARAEGIHMNKLLLRLLLRGWRAERADQRDLIDYYQQRRRHGPDGKSS